MSHAPARRYRAPRSGDARPARDRAARRRVRRRCRLADNFRIVHAARAGYFLEDEMRGAQDASPLDRAALLSLATSLGHAEYFEELRRALQARFQAIFVAIAVADGPQIARFRTVFAFGGSAGREPPPISPGLFARACDSRGAVIVT